MKHLHRSICPVSPFQPMRRPTEDDDGYESLGDAPFVAMRGEEEKATGMDDTVDADGDDVVQPAESLPVPKTPNAHALQKLVSPLRGRQTPKLSPQVVHFSSVDSVTGCRLLFSRRQ